MSPETATSPAVKRMSASDFPVRFAPRRPGDAGAVVAEAALVRERLGWQPRHENLDFIVAGALAWEESLGRRNQRD